MAVEMKDELGPAFINQKGWSMRVSKGNSAAGEGLMFSFYDEMENDIDSVFLFNRGKVEELRNYLDEILKTDLLV